MSITSSGIRYRLVSITQASETLTFLLQNATTETRSAATILKIRKLMTRFQSLKLSIKAVLKELINISFKISL